MKKRCPECGSDVEDEEVFCSPNCYDLFMYGNKSYISPSRPYPPAMSNADFDRLPF